MVWIYVVIGLLIIIVLIALLKGEKRSMRIGYGGKRVTDTLSICLSCGSKFRGSKCPYCGFEHAENEHRL